MAVGVRCSRPDLNSILLGEDRTPLLNGSPAARHHLSHQVRHSLRYPSVAKDQRGITPNLLVLIRKSINQEWFDFRRDGRQGFHDKRQTTHFPYALHERRSGTDRLHLGQFSSRLLHVAGLELLDNSS